MATHFSKTGGKRHFKRLPKWVVGLILLLLFGRFVIIAVWHWVFGYRQKGTSERRTSNAERPTSNENRNTGVTISSAAGHFSLDVRR
jgi:cytoskeletal protein RodZ